MSETSPEIVSHARLRRLGIINLCLTIVILLLLLAAFCAAHHRMREERFGREGGFHHRHHGFMERGGWGGREGFEPDRGGRFGRDGGFGRHDFGGREGGGHEGKGFGGGMGMKGMGGMDRQTPPDPALATDALLAHLTQTLTLSDDQKAKIKPIIEQQVAQFQKDQQERRQAVQKQVEESRAKIRPLLNAEQQKQLDQLPVPGQKTAAPGGKPNP